MERKLTELVERRSDEIVKMLQDLIRIETTNPYSGDVNPTGEKAGQEYLRPVLEEMGAEIEMFDCPDDIYERNSVIGPVNRDFKNRPNLVATWDFGGDGPTVVVNGHMDTVGVDTFEGDPFSAAISDGKMRGRGTSDCKGGITCGVSAIGALLTVADELKGKLIFESVVDEECNGGGAGTLSCLEAGYKGDLEVFVDGHDDTITVGCKGCLTAALGVAGEAGHAALGTGVSAIEKAALMQEAIYDFKRRREQERPEARLNLGVLRGGIHPAVVPAEARLEMNIVYELDEAAASKEATGVWGAALLRDEYASYIRAAEQKDEWLREHPCEIEWIKDLVPFDEPEDQPLVEKLSDAFESVTGNKPGIDRTLGWSDACWPSAVGGIPTILYGPSAPNAPHTDNEYVEIAAVVRCIKVLSVFLLRELT